MVSADSTRFLLISNAVAAGMALLLRWPLETLLWPYWFQSVIIGWYSRKRILALKNFSTDGFTMNDRPVPQSPQSLRHGRALLHPALRLLPRRVSRYSY